MRTCTACRHPERVAIDEALVARPDSIRDVAGQFGLSKSAVDRHRRQHLPTKLLKAAEAKEVADADSLLAQMTRLQAETLETLATVKAAQHHRTVLQAIEVARRNIELLAELTGKLAHQPTVNVLVSAEWVTVRSALLDSLVPYPEARVAVSARLLALEAGGDRGQR